VCFLVGWVEKNEKMDMDGRKTGPSTSPQNLSRFSGAGTQKKTRGLTVDIRAGHVYQQSNRAIVWGRRERKPLRKKKNLSCSSRERLRGKGRRGNLKGFHERGGKNAAEESTSNGGVHRGKKGTRTQFLFYLEKVSKRERRANKNERKFKSRHTEEKVGEQYSTGLGATRCRRQGSGWGRGVPGKGL